MPISDTLGHMFVICWFTGQATRKWWSGGQKKIKNKIEKNAKIGVIRKGLDL
jgi:hypothetical protein